MDDKNTRLRKEIEYAMTTSGFTDQMVADEMHVSRQTWWRKKHNPARMTVADIRFLYRRIGLSMEQFERGM
jgi:orotate phosphoribosyltransferase-like protein